MRRFSTVIILICSFFAQQVAAAVIDRLYDVSVPVTSQGESERKKATVEAFARLLERVTGRMDIRELEAGKTLLDQSRYFVQSFRYEPVTDSSDSQYDIEIVEKKPDATLVLEAPPEKDSNQQKLIVRFDEKEIENSLSKFKLPLWGKTRPSTLVWLAFQDYEKRVLLNSGQKSSVRQLVLQDAERYGLPLIHPAANLGDDQALNVSDVWGSFREPILAASRRYPSEAVLFARLQLVDGAWQARWSLLHNQEESNWQFNAPSLEEVINQGMQQLANSLALRYAHASTSETDGDFYLHVSNVSSLTDYATVNKYLVSLSAVKSVELSQAQANELVFRVELRSNPQALKQAIALGKTLEEREDPFAMGAGGNRLAYQLTP